VEQLPHLCFKKYHLSKRGAFAELFGDIVRLIEYERMVMSAFPTYLGQLSG
jgi:hypothetical protein